MVLTLDLQCNSCLQIFKRKTNTIPKFLTRSSAVSIRIICGPAITWKASQSSYKYIRNVKIF